MSWNGSDMRRQLDETTSRTCPPVGKSRKVAWGAVILVLLSGLGVVAILFSEHSSGYDQSVQTARQTVAKRTISQPEPTITAEAKDVVEFDRHPAEPQPTANEYAVRFPGEKIVSVETNSAGYIQVKAIKKDGGKIVHVVTPPPIFDHPTDELILAVLNTPDGQQMPPLPPGLTGAGADLRFRRSLKDEIVIMPEDSDKVRAYKEIVRSARAEIAARMDTGEHFTDIIAEQHKLCNENAKIKSDATRELNTLIKSGDAEGARKYFLAINAAFQQMGISPLKLNERSKNQVVQEVLK